MLQTVELFTIWPKLPYFLQQTNFHECKENLSFGFLISYHSWWFWGLDLTKNTISDLRPKFDKISKIQKKKFSLHSWESVCCKGGNLALMEKSSTVLKQIIRSRIPIFSHTLSNFSRNRSQLPDVKSLQWIMLCHICKKIMKLHILNFNKYTLKVLIFARTNFH